MLTEEKSLETVDLSQSPLPADNEAAAPTVNTLRALGLKKRYGSRWVVQDVSLEVKSGEVVGLLGPNGAGKTTTFNMVVGLIVSDGGTIELNGQSIAHLASGGFGLSANDGRRKHPSHFGIAAR